ncbi:MAG: aminotransferase class I/II-fold pyridoxal phosphate-dependent enzyme [SAR202 cluster bacterium]|jgi:UDP-4-amino-4,6-dideoxy-N-acetyl-beta-L-altrosamine transaminase|nr:UDP-4-amino-4,6-dideoxy-N-acetyl-beta-L-altrosamine transaminase [Chloroflexota bacterium]MDP7612512.1 aminotransferase class I/II-fold pyridoxal phosphate-dependent enzyme [Dehalococcoidia bacterium]MQG47037.1 aminotransferase class I/II-fold pyridoxal phosphate-dependent enzyme [SAR202 cluster bacterium]
MSKLAIYGGDPIRKTMLQYGRQSVSVKDIEAVKEVLLSDFLTTGPAVEKFEHALAKFCGTKYAACVSSGTAALHSMYESLELDIGDEVIVPSITFAATANAALYCGAKPVFVDVDRDTLLIDIRAVEENISLKTKIVTGVDYAGQPANYRSLYELENNNEPKFNIFADAAHSLGAKQNNKSSGSLADASSFSFHPVKGITSGEGGAITTDNPKIYKKIKTFRNHGINADYRQREDQATWEYNIGEIGFNYRLSDIHAALGLSQLSDINLNLKKRRKIAQAYDRAIDNLTGVKKVKTLEENDHSYHLYVIKLDLDKFKVGRYEFFQSMRAENIGVNVHYVPLYRHSLYSEFGFTTKDFPNSTYVYERILTLPIWPGMTDDDVNSVIIALNKVVEFYVR